MTKQYTLLFVLFLLQYYASAQNAEGCDGVRYYYDVFDEVEKTTLVYGSNTDAAGNSFNLAMDVYQPVGDTQAKRPLMIWAHGGAFVAGERVEMDSLCKRFALKGFVTATISYRLYPFLQLGIPDSLEMLDAAMKAVGDLKAAVRHFRQDAATDNMFRIDPDFIFACGLSAGAIMSIHAAYIDPTDTIPDYMADILEDNGGLEGNTGSAENQTYSSDIFAVVNLSGAIHKLEWIQADDPPIASYHGTADDVVPYNHGLAAVFGITFMSLNGSGSIHNLTEELEMENLLVSVPGADHETAYNSAAFSSYMAQFIEEGQVFIYDLLCQDIPIGTDDVSTAAPTITAAPNPSDDYILFDLLSLNETYDVTVFDVSGRILLENKNQSASQYRLEKTDLGSGLFFVQVKPIDSAIAPVVIRVVFE